jgi:Protein of unknown function (DUF669)
MSAKEMSAELAQFDHLYEAAEGGANDSFDGGVPDGEYPVVVEQVELTRTRTSGNSMLVWKFRIREGAYSGRVVLKNRVITERTIPWLKEELVKCGLKLERLSELPARIPDLPGKELRILKRTRDGNSNVYIQWSAPRAVDSDDDLPF